MRRSRVITLLSRRHLSVGQNAVSSTGQSAKKNSGWNKFALVGGPLALLGVVVTDIVCNVNHRKYLERLSPTFVGLVREYYGFDDEDPNELARIKFVKRELSKSVRVHIRDKQGNEEATRVVDGKMSIRELLGLDGEGASSWAHLHIVNRMTFEPAEAATTDTANTTVISASTSQEQEATLEYPAWALVGPSLWEAMPSSRSAGTTSTTVTSRGASSGAQDVPTQQAYIDKLIHGLSAPDRLRAVHAQAAAGPKRGNSASSSRSASTAAADVAKYRAKLRIEDLEREVAFLEAAKRQGRVEIDAADADIRQKRQEITELRRKHLNAFYYF